MSVALFYCKVYATFKVGTNVIMSCRKRGFTKILSDLRALLLVLYQNGIYFLDNFHSNVSTFTNMFSPDLCFSSCDQSFKPGKYPGITFKDEMST